MPHSLIPARLTVRFGTSSICTVLVTMLLVGCSRISPGEKQAQVYSSGASAAPAPVGAELTDVTGQAMVHDSSLPDDRAKVAALLDALRKLALGDRAESLESAQDDTIIAIHNWEGVKVLGVTIRRGGVVLLDSVALDLLIITDEKATSHRWKSNNMQLILPASSADAGLQELTDALKARGIDPVGGRPAGHGLWEEKLAVRRWNAN